MVAHFQSSRRIIFSTGTGEQAGAAEIVAEVHALGPAEVLRKARGHRSSVAILRDIWSGEHS